MSPNVQFITDSKGERKFVILPLAEYEALLEDLDDLALIAERANEPTVPLKQVLANLKIVDR